MKLLILGAKGMLGQALVKEFVGANYEVAGWDRAELDISDRERVLEKIGALKPEIIINAAAYNNVDKAETEDSDLAFKINRDAVGYLAEASALVGALFAHYSTDYVFRGDKIDGYSEDDAPEPQSVYAKSKWEGEKYLLSLRAGRSNLVEVWDRHALSGLAMTSEEFKFYLIRTSHLFGPAGAGDGAKKSFVETMIDLVENQGKTELNLIDEEVSSPTYVVDLARATRDLIESGASAGIYHRTNSGACVTWCEWARKIFTLAGLNVKLNPVSASQFLRPASRPKFSKLLTTKLLPLRPWEEALAEYLASLS